MWIITGATMCGGVWCLWRGLTDGWGRSWTWVAGAIGLFILVDLCATLFASRYSSSNSLNVGLPILIAIIGGLYLGLRSLTIIRTSRRRAMITSVGAAGLLTVFPLAVLVPVAARDANVQEAVMNCALRHAATALDAYASAYGRYPDSLGSYPSTAKYSGSPPDPASDCTRTAPTTIWTAFNDIYYDTLGTGSWLYTRSGSSYVLGYWYTPDILGVVGPRACLFAADRGTITCGFNRWGPFSSGGPPTRGRPSAWVLPPYGICHDPRPPGDYAPGGATWGQRALVSSVLSMSSTVGDVVWSLDGRRLAALNQTVDTLMLWTQPRGTAIRSLDIAHGSCSDASLPGGKLAYELGLWRFVDRGAPVDLFPTTQDRYLSLVGANPSVYAFSPDGRVLATSAGAIGYTGPEFRYTVALRRLTVGTPPRSLDPGGLEIGDLLWFPDGRRLLVVTGDDRMAAWDTGTGQRLWSTTAGHNVDPREPGMGDIRATISPDGRLIATVGGQESALTIWSGTSGRRLRTLGSTGMMGGDVSFNADGRLIAVGTIDGGAQILQEADGRVVDRLAPGLGVLRWGADPRVAAGTRRGDRHVYILRIAG